MKIHHYHPETGQYLGESVAVADPLDAGRFLVPANATKTAPPAEQPNKMRVFENGMWLFRQIVADGAISSQTDPTPFDVKLEAGRRILAIAPDWKQRNLTARAAEFAIKLAEGGTLTAAEKDERAAGEAIWTRIKSIRAASDALEAMNPIPADFASNEAHWP